MKYLVYKKSTNEEKIPKYENVTTIKIEDVVGPIAQNLFSVFPDNENYNSFIKQLYELGSVGDSYFWVDQACQRLINNHEDLNHRLMIVNNDEEVKFLVEERGDFVLISKEELDKLPEVIDGLRASIEEINDSEAVE